MTELFGDHNSDFLFARPTFVGGIARILDFWGTLKVYNISPSAELADLSGRRVSHHYGKLLLYKTR
jgi:hypothetical protein